MISRVADHCFWLARYLERAENTARVLEVNHTLLLDFDVPVEQQWKPLLIISGLHDYEHPPTADRVQEYMTWDRENPFSIASSLAWARENARIIREVISGEMWERINFYHLWVQNGGARAVYDASRTEFYAQVRRINQLLHGIADATMSHGEAWEFFKLGTHLERASQTARILDVKYHTLLPKVEDVGTPIDNAHWVAILMSCSGAEPFYKTARAVTTEPGFAVAEFLLFDEQFPRSVRHCLEVSHEAATAAAGPTAGRPPTAAERAIAALIQWMDARSMADVIREGLHETLTHIVDSVHDIGEAVHASFIAPELPAMTQTQTLGGMSQTQTQA